MILGLFTLHPYMHCSHNMLLVIFPTLIFKTNVSAKYPKQLDATQKEDCGCKVSGPLLARY